MAAADLKQELIDEIGAFALDPLGFVLFAFPWGEPDTMLADAGGPFAYPVAAPWQGRRPDALHTFEYDPYAELLAGERGRSLFRSEHDPFARRRNGHGEGY